MDPALPSVDEVGSTRRRPRVGFLGTGWIGAHRLKALARRNCVDIAALFDRDPQAAAAAARLAGGARVCSSWEALLEQDLTAIVIATPTALHAEQTVAALDAGLAVLCQKPLARNSAEARLVIDTARRARRLLSVDMSYRYLRSTQRVREFVQQGAIGTIFAADLVFHNAYGPDKSWYYTPELSGGGCVIDLGVHLIDLALWVLGFPDVAGVSSRLFTDGQTVVARARLEDYGCARLDLTTGATINIACSWRLSAGCDAVIRAAFYGTDGALEIANVGGSFYDFKAELFKGTARKTLDEPPDEWGGRATIAWAEQLCRNADYDPEIESAVRVAEVIDRIYET